MFKILFVDELPQWIVSSNTGAYDPEEKTIYIRRPKPKPYLFARIMCKVQMYQFLLHEIGHWVAHKKSWGWMHKWLDGGEINFK